VTGKMRPRTGLNSTHARKDSPADQAAGRNNAERPCGTVVPDDTAFAPGTSPAKWREASSISVSGILELLPSGYGFLRDPAISYKPSAGDPLVPAAVIDRFDLRPGTLVRGAAQLRRDGKGPVLHEFHEVEEGAPDEYHRTPRFAALTAIHPQVPLRLETGPQSLSTRLIDLFAPVGKGQRALIVAPPRTGKTMLLKEIGQAVAANHPEVKLVMLLVDERPEEVTEMRRQVAGDILASNLDQEVERHVRLSQLVIERCKRLAESGRDVVLLIDSLTRMARAFNKSVSHSGKTLTGGLDVRALDVPKKLFAAARAFEEGGSLTILATVLVETGSRMDDLIFEEFKGTGNLELVLDRRLADRRIWPAIDLTKSGTRREEKLLDARTLQAVTYRRRIWNPRDPAETMQDLTAQLNRHKSKLEFVNFTSRQAANSAAA
jgi:transcription termination factor Rho